MAGWHKSDLRLLLRHPLGFARQYRLALAVLVVGAALDAVTTWRIVRVLGPDAEVHPVQRMVMHALGPDLGVPAAKIIQVAFVLLVASLWRFWCGPLMGLAGLLYTAAAAHNHLQYVRHVAPVLEHLL